MDDGPSLGVYDYYSAVLDDFDAFIERGMSRFDRQAFASLRRRTFAQHIWAEAASVSAGTISNWERGVTVPDRAYRRALILAAEELREEYRSMILFDDVDQGLLIDPIQTKQELKRSILRAALTDFDLDADGRQIVPIPFRSDSLDYEADEFVSDRSNLLESLNKQADALIEELAVGSNVESDKFIRQLERYKSECAQDEPNPRLLNRWGQIISRGANSEDFKAAVNHWDDEAFQGFERDHLELMRLYFREALARAQEIDAAQLIADAEIDDGTQFSEIASMMENAVAADGEPLVDNSVPTILRDIANEMRELSDGIVFTQSEERKKVLRRRLSEAFKTGSIYVGRFVFCTALVAAVANPVTVGYVGSIASIIGVIEIASPGTVRSKYEKLREMFPILPPLPEIKKK